MGCLLDDRGFFESRQELGIFLFTTVSTPALGTTQMGTRGFFPGGYSGPGLKLTTHLHIVPRSRMYGGISPLPQYAFMAWCSVKKYR
jgi:hypothetical protein